MEHEIDGRICARICPNVEVPIEDATIRVYRPPEDVDNGKLVEQRFKESFQVLDAEAVEEKAHRHVDDFGLDGEGCFVASLRERLDYDGEAVQLDLRVEAIDGVEITPVQTTLTTIQPSWESAATAREDTEHLAEWDCCLTESMWCSILEAAEYYVVAGRITNCETEDPLDDLTVTVRDKDIVEPDVLGSDTTDANGVYVVYYPRSALEETPSPLPDFELVGGPDLYFQVDSPAGTPLVDEDPSDGRQPGREDAGRCHCEDFCVDFSEGPDPLFTHVGKFNIIQDIDADGTTNKSRAGTAGDGWGFHNVVKFHGYVPETSPGTGKQQFFRFLYDDGSGPTPLTGDLVAPLRVGLYFDSSLPGPLNVSELWVANAAFTPNTSLPSDVLVPTRGNSDSAENGWVEVRSPYDDALSGQLMRFDTRDAVPGGSGGTATPTSGPSTPRTGEQIEVIFETTVADSNGDPDPAERDTQRETVTLYVNNYSEVRELDVVDAQGQDIGCKVTDTAKVQYNADHEFLRETKVSLASQASGQSGVTLPGPLERKSIDRAGRSPGDERHWQGVVDLQAEYTGSSVTDFDDWPSCTYISKLHTRRALTDGDDNDDWDSTPAVDGAFYID